MNLLVAKPEKLVTFGTVSVTNLSLVKVIINLKGTTNKANKELG